MLLPWDGHVGRSERARGLGLGSACWQIPSRLLSGQQVALLIAGSRFAAKSFVLAGTPIFCELLRDVMESQARAAAGAKCSRGGLPRIDSKITASFGEMSRLTDSKDI